MLRPAQLVLGTVLFAACASPRPAGSSDAQRDALPSVQSPAPARVETQASAARDERELRYLRGIEQPQVRRLSSIASSERLASDSVMHAAMISGIDEFYVAASAFTKGEHIALDMIVVNHRGEAMQVHRKDVKLYDASGRALTAEQDFPGAEQLGLRGTGQVDAPGFLYESPDEFGVGDDLPQDPADGAGKDAMRPSSRPGRARGNAAEWRGLQPSGPRVLAPATLHVAPGSGEAWWAYWKVDAPVAYPITAFVVFGEQQLMFQFDQDLGSPAR